MSLAVNKLYFAIAVIAMISIIAAIYIMAYRKNKQHFQEDKCTVRCIGSDKNIMNQWDCCECKSIEDGFQEDSRERFRKCMCKAGYGDFCFKEFTNFLLSQ